MLQQEIHSFLERFFTANKCKSLESSNGHISVQLTEEMDKELMNRPFYWHYLEKTGGTPNPMSLTMITDQASAPAGIKGEQIHFGSPRLHQLFAAAQKLGRHIRLYENQPGHPGVQVKLVPWLCINAKISYQCDRRREICYSIGLQLINGQMYDGFHDWITRLKLTPRMPDYAFILSPLIKPASGTIRIKKMLQQRISQEDDTWADEAIQRWNADLALLEHFYEDTPQAESYEVEKQALREQYEPKIHITMINSGLFYLASNPPG